MGPQNCPSLWGVHCTRNTDNHCCRPTDEWYTIVTLNGDRDSTVGKVLCYKLEGRWFDSRFRSHYGTGVDSASNRNENQEYFLGVKSGQCLRLITLPPSWAIVTKSGNLNFLEPSGHLGPVMGLIYLFSHAKREGGDLELLQQRVPKLQLGYVTSRTLTQMFPCRVTYGHDFRRFYEYTVLLLLTY